MSIENADVSRETSPVPEPVMSGKFAIYQTPQGGYHLAYRTDDAEEDRHIDVPAHLVKMLNTVGANPKGLMGKMMGMFGGGFGG